MAFCGKCGTRVEDGVTTCPACGNVIAAAPVTEQPVQQPAANQADFTSKVAALNDTADTTAEFDANDVTQNKTMGILAYLGPLVFVPMFAAKGSKFARYHANQGLVLLLACIAYNIAYAIINAILIAISWRLVFIGTILGFVSIVFLVLAIIGIVNAANGKAKELPLIGKIKILK